LYFVDHAPPRQWFKVITAFEWISRIAHLPTGTQRSILFYGALF
jgi:hypothetical protein